ncbi:MAG: hypothetical protein M3P44_07510 [Actinomycetota bacterium]|nr:hypothetical protein [Actinomycetota bacterium]
MAGDLPSTPSDVVASLVRATNAHDIDAFVSLFAEDDDSRQPAFSARDGAIAGARLYVEPVEPGGAGIDTAAATMARSGPSEARA